MKKLILFVAFLFASQSYFACDICGCGGSANYLGILPLVEQSFLGYRFGYSKFNHPNTAENMNGTSQVLQDRFYQNDVWMRFYPTEKIQMYAFVPYKVNVRSESQRTTTLHGLGDIQGMINYKLVQTPDSSSSNWKHFWVAGASLKLPTGKYQQKDETYTTLPAFFQLGTGAWAYGINTIYTVRYKQWGVNLNTALLTNGTNEAGYKFGNQATAALSAFYVKDYKKSTWLPQIGLNLEHFEKDTSFGQIESATGGTRLLATAGADCYIGKFVFSIYTQLPISQLLPASQPQVGMRYGIAASAFF